MNTRTITSTLFLLLLLLCPACFSPEPDESEQEESEQEESQDQLEDELDSLREEDEVDWTFDTHPSEFVEQLPDEVGGFDIPEDIDSSPRYEPNSSDELPEYFDWRDKGVVSAIQNQGECGSCWAFAAASIAESAFAINAEKEVDISEQWLVNCNTEGWGCEGGLLALPYFVNQADICGGVGAVLENQMPYLETRSECTCNQERLNPIPGWVVISTPGRIASTEEIKRAIKENGPIVATINADITFACYSKGIYNRRTVFAIPNHLIVITGWDDRLGSNGIWFLRNSYGLMWGELGTMRIEYGVASVGLFAAGFTQSNSEHPNTGAGDSNKSTTEPANKGSENEGTSQEESNQFNEDSIQSDETGNKPESEGFLDELAILDHRLGYLDDALDSQAEGVLPPTPSGATVDPDDLEIDPAIIKPQDFGILGIWKQINGSSSPDVAPGGYQKSYLLISPSGLLEFVRFYGNRETFKTTTRLDWRISDSTIIIGEDKDLSKHRMKKNLNLTLGSKDLVIVAPSSRLPSKLKWSLKQNSSEKTLSIGSKTWIAC